MKLRYSRRAQDDLASIHSYLAERSSAGAINVMTAIYTAIAFIRSRPDAAPKATLPGVRVKIVQKYGFKIFTAWPTAAMRSKLSTSAIWRDVPGAGISGRSNIPVKDYADDPRAIAIAKAAKRLDELRNTWLNPPDLIRIEPEVVAGYPDRILPKDAQAAVTLKSRTLTNLYNQRPQWLADAHSDLDAAVAAAYGWPADISEEDALAKLLELNLSRAAADGDGPSLLSAGDDRDENADA